MVPAERAEGFRDGGYMIDFAGPGLDAARPMGLEPRLAVARHHLAGLTCLDREGRRASGIDAAGTRAFAPATPPSGPSG